MRQIKPFLFFATALGVAFVSHVNSASGQLLTDSTGKSSDRFGASVSAFGTFGVVGAPTKDFEGIDSGGAFFFSGLSGNKSGVATERVRLSVSTLELGNYFGEHVSMYGDSALVAAMRHYDGTSLGNAFYYRDLSSSPTRTAFENVILKPSDGAWNDFGSAVSLFEDSALVGAYKYGVDRPVKGAAYYFRGLDSNTSGIATENVKLSPSSGLPEYGFGEAVSLFGDSALVGAKDYSSSRGAAYYFRGLDENTSGSATQDVRLRASDAASDDRFSQAVSLHGDNALIGSPYSDLGDKENAGSAYYFKNLDGNTIGEAFEDIKLLASDGDAYDHFGQSVSLSGDSALVGADGEDDVGDFLINYGAAYYFDGLNSSAGGIVNEVLKLTAANETASGRFGYSVSLSGDSLVVGALFGDGNVTFSGAAYAGRISNMTVLDMGDSIRTHTSISFESRVDWTIGDTTSKNWLTLAHGTSAEVMESGKAIRIGANADANRNRLTVEGTIYAQNLFIGSQDGNVNNSLFLKKDSDLNVDNVYLSLGNWLILEGDFTDFDELLAHLQSSSISTSLYADNGLNGWELIDSSNASQWLASSYISAYGGATVIGLAAAVPEPNTALLLGLTSIGLIFRRRRVA